MNLLDGTTSFTAFGELPDRALITSSALPSAKVTVVMPSDSCSDGVAYDASGAGHTHRTAPNVLTRLEELRPFLPYTASPESWSTHLQTASVPPLCIWDLAHLATRCVKFADMPEQEGTIRSVRTELRSQAAGAVAGGAKNRQ